MLAVLTDYSSRESGSEQERERKMDQYLTALASISSSGYRVGAGNGGS